MSRHTRLLGVDYGSVRIGLAISDEDRRIASPLTTYAQRGRDPDAAFFRRLVQSEAIGTLIVGLPVLFDGTEGKKAAEARRFGSWLAEITTLPTSYFDESFTTVEAERHLLAAGLTAKRRKARRDRLAAQIMLQAYLDSVMQPINPNAETELHPALPEARAPQSGNRPDS